LPFRRTNRFFSNQFAQSAHNAFFQYSCVDGGTIRKLKTALNPKRSESTPIYAQVIDDIIVNTYTFDQLIYGIRNPSTNLQRAGYGQSELELLITTITTLLNAERYNSLALSQGGTQKGLLVIKGDIMTSEFDIKKAMNVTQGE